VYLALLAEALQFFRIELARCLRRRAGSTHELAPRRPCEEEVVLRALRLTVMTILAGSQLGCVEACHWQVLLADAAPVLLQLQA
jgi:hypothetical protein